MALLLACDHPPPATGPPASSSPSLSLERAIENIRTAEIVALKDFRDNRRQPSCLRKKDGIDRRRRRQREVVRFVSRDVVCPCRKRSVELTDPRGVKRPKECLKIDKVESIHIHYHQISGEIGYFLVVQFWDPFFASWCNLQFSLSTMDRPSATIPSIMERAHGCQGVTTGSSPHSMNMLRFPRSGQDRGARDREPQNK